MAIDPMYGIAAGAGLEGLGGLIASGQAKRAKRAAKQRRTGALGNVYLAGSTARQDVAETFGDQQSGLRNSLGARGLTGSTAFDAALNSNLGNRQRAMSRVNEGVAREKNAILGQFDDQVSGNNWLTGLGGLVGKAGTTMAMLDGIGDNDRVTKAQLNGGEAKAKLTGGGFSWDELMRMLGRG